MEGTFNAQNEDFRIIKEKIIKTNKVLLIFNEKNEKLSKITQAFRSLKLENDSMSVDYNRLKLQNERLMDISQRRQTELEQTLKEYNALKPEHAKLCHRFEQNLIESQLVISDLEKKVKQCFCDNKFGLSASSHETVDDKVRKLKQLCKELKNDKQCLKSENDKLLKLNETLKEKLSNNAEVNRLSKELSSVKEKLLEAEVSLQNKSKVLNVIESLKKDHKKEVNSLKNQISALTLAQQRVKLLEEECLQLKIQMNNSRGNEKARDQSDTSTQTDFSQNSFECAAPQENEIFESESIESDDFFIRDIFKEMKMSVTVLSPLRVSPILRERIHFEESMVNSPLTLPDIIITPPTPKEDIKENNLSLMFKESDKSLQESCSKEDCKTTANNFAVVSDPPKHTSSQANKCNKKISLESSNNLSKENAPSNEISKWPSKENKNNSLQQSKLLNTHSLKTTAAKSGWVRKYWMPYSINHFVKPRNKQARSRKVIKPLSSANDSILDALRVLQKNNINFIISNKTNPIETTENNRSLLEAKLKMDEKLDACYKPFLHTLTCGNKNCIKRQSHMVLRHVPTQDEPELLGFCSSKDNFNISPVNYTASKEDSKNSNLEELVHKLLIGFKELTQASRLEQKRKKLAKIKNLPSETGSMTESELERLYGGSNDVLLRNKRLLAEARKQSFESDWDLIGDSGIATAESKNDTDTLSLCGQNEGKALNNSQQSFSSVFPRLESTSPSNGKSACQGELLKETDNKCSYDGQLNLQSLIINSEIKTSATKEQLTCLPLNDSAENIFSNKFNTEDGNLMDISIETKDLDYSLHDINLTQLEECSALISNEKYDFMEVEPEKPVCKLSNTGNIKGQKRSLSKKQEGFLETSTGTNSTRRRKRSQAETISEDLTISNRKEEERNLYIQKLRPRRSSLNKDQQLSETIDISGKRRRRSLKSKEIISSASENSKSEIDLQTIVSPASDTQKVDSNFQTNNSWFVNRYIEQGGQEGSFCDNELTKHTSSIKNQIEVSLSDNNCSGSQAGSTKNPENFKSIWEIKTEATSTETSGQSDGLDKIKLKEAAKSNFPEFKKKYGKRLAQIKARQNRTNVLKSQINILKDNVTELESSCSYNLLTSESDNLEYKDVNTVNEIDHLKINLQSPENNSKKASDITQYRLPKVNQDYKSNDDCDNSRYIINDLDNKVQIIQSLLITTGRNTFSETKAEDNKQIASEDSDCEYIPFKIPYKTYPGRRKPYVKAANQDSTQQMQKSKVVEAIISSEMSNALCSKIESGPKESSIENKNTDVDQSNTDPYRDSPKSLVKCSKELTPLKSKQQKIDMPPSRAFMLLHKLAVFSSEDVVLEEIVKEFADQRMDYMTLIILEKLCHDIHDQADVAFPPSPPMTSIQRILLGFLIKLEKSTHPNIIDCFLEAAEQKVYNKKTCNIHIAQPITRLYTAICRMRYDINRMRRFICECFFFTGDFAVPILFTTLTMWPNVLPMESEISQFPLAKVIVQLCHLKMGTSPGYNLLPLKTMLKKFFKYNSDRWDCDELFTEILSQYIHNPSVRLSDFTLLLFLKNKPPKWAFTKVRENLLPLYKSVPDTNPNLKATLLILFGNICHYFNPYDMSEKSLITEMDLWFEELKAVETNPILIQAIDLAKNRLPKNKQKKALQKKQARKANAVQPTLSTDLENMMDCT